jgi:phosphoribosyl 1,2-cyclic phosphate phosphodiesterase
MNIHILGSGTSHGIPVVGCDCPVCTSKDPFDKRMRSSLLVEGGGVSLVIDTGPEFRLQAIRAGLKKLDAVLLTHAHADHLHGLDDVRPLSHKKAIAVFGNTSTITELKERFSYVFTLTQEGGGKPRLAPKVVTRPFTLGGLTITPIPVKHGELDILGWYIIESAAESDASAPQAGGGILYLTDCSRLPSKSQALINQPEAAIIGGLRERPHPTHFSFAEALETGIKIGAKKIFLTHLCHNHSHSEITRYCAQFKRKNGIKGTKMAPAYDGLELVL